MSCGCIMTNPLTLAIQAEAFGRYIIQAFELKMCSSWQEYAEKLIGFFVVCKYKN